MFSKKKNTKIDVEQHELVENAQKRIAQKKKLYTHFVVFLIGSVFLILINKILKYGQEYDWFIWAITFWAFLFALHIFNVFITNRFMGKEWERSQREKLIRKQQERINVMQKELDTQQPLEIEPKKKLY
ncbi:2TM domain-containing protein [Maribacter sp. MAR_2009_72]|uniref:2TM domain-containing protein n=1 Tax=Maribacter sp. MAR_2009_72 TaxID=1250050 RepID=UPI00119AB169|nr:2TM domain-containing protein [Maribacter sp. MAR_2009_72]TVZ15363.1 2TM domain-containing protein [Maribacter sp. MAR_2009_72]